VAIVVSGVEVYALMCVCVCVAKAYTLAWWRFTGLYSLSHSSHSFPFLPFLNIKDYVAAATKLVDKETRKQQREARMTLEVAEHEARLKERMERAARSSTSLKKKGKQIMYRSRLPERKSNKTGSMMEKEDAEAAQRYFQ
jgi:hypothetical protein